MAESSIVESCAPLPAGGYECDFVDDISEALLCPVCLLPYRDPHILDCCGAKYCTPCIGRVKAAGQPCPLCKQEFSSLLDRNDQRKVLSLKVRCSRKKDGCEWEGELRHLSDHEKGVCVLALVECRYHCGERLPRRQLAEHEQELCPQRPVDVKLESFMRKMEERHMREMAAVREELEMIKQQMNELKEEKENYRRELERIKQHVEEKEQLMERKLAEQQDELKQLIARNKMVKQPLCIEMDESLPMTPIHSPLQMYPPCELVMNDYQRHKIARDAWYSSPFYTAPGGLKLCLCVEDFDVYKCISLCVYLMREENDDRLMWRVCGDITIQLINQAGDQDHHEMTIPVSDTEIMYSLSRVTSGDKVSSIGCVSYISRSVIETTAKTRQYLKNDCLKFRVTKAELSSM